MKKIILIFVKLLFFNVLIFAQSPSLFQYQAVVRDAGGNPVTNQSVGFRISIISGSISGPVEYSESHVASTNNFGVITINIGGGIPLMGTFSGINWGNSSHFIKVEADSSGGTSYLDMGTTQLLSVPYALYAQNSGNGDTLWNVNGNNIYNTNSGNIGVGTNNPSGRMVVQGDVNAQATDPLFEVKNAAGQSVFVVYQDSVNVFVNDDAIQSNRGGFAVSGRNNAKAITNKYLHVTPDNSMIWTKDTIKGFGVENINGASKISYMQMTPNNYFMGHQSGISNTAGMYNSFLGYQSGMLNTSGSSNIFLGYQAGFNNLTGSENVFIGNQCGNNNVSGYSNVAQGYKTLFSNTAGHTNVALGAYALTNNTLGNFNIACGYYALSSNTTGSQNIAIGVDALRENNTGLYNVAIGMNSLYSNQGNGNVSLGAYTLVDNSVGSSNTATGHAAMRYNISGDFNSGFGSQALGANSTGMRNTALGYNALVANFDGNYNTALGCQAFSSGTSFSNSTAIGYNAVITASNKVRLGDVNVTEVEGQVAYTFPSDARFKSNVTEEVKGLDFITRLRPVVYNFDTKKFDEFLMQDVPDSIKKETICKKDYSESTNIRQSGFIAQEVEQAAKESGFDFNGVHKPTSDKDNYSVAYSLFTVPLVKGMQEQQQLIEKLQKENVDLMQSNSDLLKRIEKIESLIYKK